MKKKDEESTYFEKWCLYMTIKNFGLDEAGKLSDRFIHFARVEIDDKKEVELFIKILTKTGDFFYSNEILNNEKTNKIASFCNDLLDDQLVKVKFYKLIPEEQTKILNDAMKFQANHLFRIRDDLISMYEKEKVNKGKLNVIIRNLHHYRKYSIFPDSAMKSYSFLYILNDMCNNHHICNFLKEDDNYINVQIDGGFFFTFWWHNLINYHENMEILHSKLFIRGIAHGDESYLSINLADLFVRAYHRSSMRFQSCEVVDIKYDFKNLPLSVDTFFNKFWDYLGKNIFKKRVLLIGKSELFNLITYILHRKNRQINYEPFIINGNISYFFKRFSSGYPSNNVAIFGDILNDTDENNIKICRDKSIDIFSIKDFQEDFINFFDLIERISESYDTITKKKLKDVIYLKKEYLDNVQEV
ncbi:hypothetical protein LCGC14_1792130 [marine sediment metagenome]|uniref:Uncharacterized protein n=1 Tax=marine sediment metagenome TaxID=412755 RepID=A0A0F9GS98_9ZZZZ